MGKIMKSQINQVEIYNRCIEQGKSVDVLISIHPNLDGNEMACLVTDYGWLSSLEFKYQPPYGIVDEVPPIENLKTYLDDLFSNKIEVAPYANDASLTENLETFKEFLNEFKDDHLDHVEKGFLKYLRTKRSCDGEMYMGVDFIPHYVKAYRNDDNYKHIKQRLCALFRLSENYVISIKINSENSDTKLLAQPRFGNDKMKDKDAYHFITVNGGATFGKGSTQFLYNDDIAKEKASYMNLMRLLINVMAEPFHEVKYVMSNDEFTITRVPFKSK